MYFEYDYSRIAPLIGGNERKTSLRCFATQWRSCNPNSKCAPGFYCHFSWCYPYYQCNHHTHCPTNWGCDHSIQVCKPGLQRYCTNDYHCTSGRSYCKNGLCMPVECSYHGECPAGQRCNPPGVCRTFNGKCRYHVQCSHGYVCYKGFCARRQCYHNSQCKPDFMCRYPGMCEPSPGYCISPNSCGENQCCLRAYNPNYGTCSNLLGPGDWCNLSQRPQTCPCKPGYKCQEVQQKWGQCVAIATQPPPTEVPGSGEIDA
ncbi:platelet endothelial aggregation receptor 1 isoform X2 [Nematostella vectensis]|uniref:platelet endothelial aggregation receptor 1 isoform X2 n=1 Tax=Nematostella vectensis TaxID=45351 RepID=UPI002077749D|nr:platelet endothelial aggregation receptor 1 isoform X2 [Nematostella vectensis]